MGKQGEFGRLRICRDDCELRAGDMRTMCSIERWGRLGFSAISVTSRRSIGVIGEAKERLPMRVLAWYMLPNHWHGVGRVFGIAKRCHPLIARFPKNGHPHPPSSRYPAPAPGPVPGLSSSSVPPSPGASRTAPAQSSSTTWASRRSLPSTTTSASSAWTSIPRPPGQLIKPLPQSPTRLLSSRLSNLQPAGPHNSSQLFKKVLPKTSPFFYTPVHVPLRLPPPLPPSAFRQHSSFGWCPTYVHASSSNCNALNHFRSSPSPDFFRNTRSTLHRE